MVSETVNIPVVASGGAGKLEDIQAVLTAGKADAALAATIFHFGQYTINEVKQYLHKKGVNVRLDRQGKKGLETADKGRIKPGAEN